MAHSAVFLALAVSAFCAVSLTFAMDPAGLQDFCVADPNSNVRLNGFACKNPATVQANDFSFSGLHVPGNTSNVVGSRVTTVSGDSDTRPEHSGDFVGSLEVGFVTSNPENRLISKIIHKGDVFVFPIGLIHFQRNVGYGNAVAIAGLSSQNPGVITVANSVFGSKPEISGDVLAKAFQVDKRVVEQIQAKF
ncbi:Putative germin-like protein 2-1 [Linum perenne]